MVNQSEVAALRWYAAAAAQGLVAATWHDSSSARRIAEDAFDIAETMVAEEAKRRADPAKSALYAPAAEPT